MSTDAHAGGHDHHHGPSYFSIYLILLALFIVSVAGPELAKVLELDPVAAKITVLITAFGIAFVKAYYVVAYFMHLKFEKKYINYMLVTVTMFMGLFFSAVAPDIMKHEGTNWQNASAKAEIARAMHVIEHGPSDVGPIMAANLEPDPASISNYKKIAGMKYQIPIDKAMEVVVHEGIRPVFLVSTEKPKATMDDFEKAEVKAKELALGAKPVFAVNAAKAEQGKGLFVSKTCSACHSVDGSKLVGPSMKGFLGRVSITDTATAFVSTPDYFRESIKAPQAKIVRNYGPQMPALPVNDEEIELLLHYIATL